MAQQEHPHHPPPLHHWPPISSPPPATTPSDKRHGKLIKVRVWREWRHLAAHARHELPPRAYIMYGWTHSYVLDVKAFIRRCFSKWLSLTLFVWLDKGQGLKKALGTHRIIPNVSSKKFPVLFFGISSSPELGKTYVSRAKSNITMKYIVCLSQWQNINVEYVSWLMASEHVCYEYCSSRRW